jgi:hypothetical protein
MYLLFKRNGAWNQAAMQRRHQSRMTYQVEILAWAATLDDVEVGWIPQGNIDQPRAITSS